MRNGSFYFVKGKKGKADFELSKNLFLITKGSKFRKKENSEMASPWIKVIVPEDDNEYFNCKFENFN